MLICHNINHTTHHADGSYHHLEVPYLKVTAGVPVIIDGDDDDGKQILINILSGLTFAQGADIKLFESSPFALSLKHRHQTIGYFGDKDSFKPLLRVRDNLELFSGGALDEILCRNLFEFFELDYTHFIDKEYGALDEEMQMVLRAIGCFIAEPPVYFLHLPFCILPTHFHLVLCELLTQRSDNIVIISHQKGHFLPLEGDKYSMYEGKLWHQGKLVEPDASYLDKETQAQSQINPVANPDVALENLALENLALENLALENLALENLALENLVGQFPLPENKEQMVTQILEHAHQDSSDSNVFAKFLTPIDDVTPIKKQDSAPVESIKIDPIQIDPEQTNPEQTNLQQDDSNDARDAISNDLTDINMQADEVTHETADMMADVQMEALHHPSEYLQIEEEIEPEIVEERVEQSIDEATPPAENIEAPPQEFSPAILQEIITPEKIEVETANISTDAIEEESVFITRINQPEIIVTDSGIVPEEAAIEEADIEEPAIAETTDTPKEVIEEAIIAEEIITEEIVATESAIEEEPANNIATQQIDVFQQNKHQKFAYQPLDDTDNEIYQPTPSHFNDEPFIPPHSDDPNIIAKFEQHLHHVPEIGTVFQRELGRYQPIAHNDLKTKNDANPN